MRGRDARPDLALGYFDDDSATATVYDADGWAHLGDLGTLNADGYLRLVGRVKEIINRGGRKISIAEVEAAVSTVPGVHDVAALAYPDPDLGERCAASSPMGTHRSTWSACEASRPDSVCRRPSGPKRST